MKYPTRLRNALSRHRTVDNGTAMWVWTSRDIHFVYDEPEVFSAMPDDDDVLDDLCLHFWGSAHKPSLLDRVRREVYRTPAIGHRGHGEHLVYVEGIPWWVPKRAAMNAVLMIMAKRGLTGELTWCVSGVVMTDFLSRDRTEN